MGNLKIHLVLRRLMTERGVTLTELSKRAKIPKSTLSTWLSGTKPKDPEQIAAAAKSLGTTMHVLLFDEAEVQVTVDSLATEPVLDGLYRLRLEKVIIPKRKTAKEET